MNSSNRILLINPWIHDFAAYDFWIKPLGLLYLASFLRDNGFAIDFIDCLDPWNTEMLHMASQKALRRSPAGHGKYFKQCIDKPAALRTIPKNYHRYGMDPSVFLRKLLEIPTPHLVLVTSMMTYWYPGVFEAIGIIREVLPDIPIVLGGNYATLSPTHAALSGADFVIPGAGEEGLPRIIQEIFGLNLPCISDKQALDSYPYPAFDLITRTEQLPIRTSRGCPFFCTYCASRILNPRFTRRDPDKVFAEIQHWYSTRGVRHFSLYDDAFLVQPEDMAVPLLKEIVNHQLPCEFHCPNGLHVREITAEVAQMLYRAHFKTIRFGFETADESRQNSTGGKVTNDDLKRAVRYLNQAGYERNDIGVYLLCGLPGQSADEVRESILFVKSCGARPILAEYSPIPGTFLWEEALKVSPFDIATEPLYHNNTLLPCQGDKFTADMYRGLKSLTLAY